ncbi:MAG: sigma 54-interacting transcriptional regulator [Deltaproteobacteria bacterium]|jgi:PAS domain S-box-containing protein|nr:sigma 54-interacting transcriptional regulator [Deltaproteobacteria bacterium]
MDDILVHYRQLGLIFDTFSMGVMIVAADRKIISLNHSAEIITGHNESDLRGKYCSQVLLEPLCGGECQYLNAIESDRQAGSVNFEISDRNKGKQTITRIVSPIYGPDRRPLGCIEVFQDHTVFRDLLERVRHDDRRLKIILDNLDIGVLTVDRGGHITFFNNRAETITGFNRGDVLGKSCSVIFGKTTSHHMLLFEETIADGRARSTSEGEIRTRDGQAIPIRANYMALKNEDGRIVGGLATISDLSLKYQFNSEIRGRYTFYDMVGKDPAMQKIFEIVPVVAATDATVLIEGPTGTGKDILAKVIHSAGKRSKKPLVKVNCAALPDNLLESEMFGYVKGAFTGAEKDKPGRFQEADGGTIFLDEIGDLPLSLQAKLLRVLEDQEFYPLGSRKTTRVDVRIISATNQNLEQQVRDKRFREDLFYRLNVMRLELPALKDRKGDIPLLISHILKRLCATRDTSVEKISNDAMEVLLNHDYPGNVRELENIIEHALIVCQDKIIERNHLPLSLQGGLPSRRPARELPSFNKEIEYSEKTLILEALKKHNWNKGKTAASLDMNRSTLWRKMKKYQISA